MDDVDHLRRLCVNDPQVGRTAGRLWIDATDARTRAMVVLSALVAIDAPQPSIHAAVDDAITAGVTTREIIGLLDGLVPVIGLPRVVAVAPRLAAALGHGEDLTLDLR